MVIEALTALLVLITAFYAWATYRILKANETVVEVARLEAENLARPYVVVRAFTVSDSPLLHLEIENTGKTPAFELRLELDRDFYQFGEKKEDNNLRALEVFQKKIDCFSPGAKLPFYLAIGNQIFAGGADADLMPLVFTVTASYSFGNKTVKEKTTIDLRMYRNSALVADAVSAELKNIRDAINKLPVELGKQIAKKT